MEALLSPRQPIRTAASHAKLSGSGLGPSTTRNARTEDKLEKLVILAGGLKIKIETAVGDLQCTLALKDSIDAGRDGYVS